MDNEQKSKQSIGRMVHMNVEESSQLQLETTMHGTEPSLRITMRQWRLSQTARSKRMEDRDVWREIVS